jgi:hypothetical protein
MALAGVASMYAGSLTINPGNQLNPDGTVSVGLLPSGPLGNNLNNQDGITGSSFRSQNYLNSTNVLFGHGTPNNPLPDSPTTCVTCQSTLFTPSGGNEFYLLGDNTTADMGTSTNFWISTSTGNGTSGTTAGSIAIPVGVFGVSTVDTLLNTAVGLSTGGTQCITVNAQNCTNTNSYATITLTFATASDFLNGITSNEATETFALINGVTQRNILNGMGGSATTIASSYTATDIGTDLGTTANVAVKNVYTTGTSTGSTMFLDEQIFPVLTQYQNDYLVSITINDYGSASTSHELLSAITVTPTPEPSTVAMLFAGLGAIGVARMRRRKTNQ